MREIREGAEHPPFSYNRENGRREKAWGRRQDMLRL